MDMDLLRAQRELEAEVNARATEIIRQCGLPLFAALELAQKEIQRERRSRHLGRALAGIRKGSDHD